MMSIDYHHDVRTTLTLADDVAAKLQLATRNSGRSFKEIVNEVLRLGLAIESQPKPPTPFRVRPVPLGLPAGMSYDHVWELIEQLEERNNKTATLS